MMPDEPDFEKPGPGRQERTENSYDPGSLFRNRTLAKEPGFELKKNDGRHVLQNPQTSESMTLNDSAALVWSLMEDKLSLAEIVAEIQCTFRLGPSRIAGDIEEIANQFVFAGVAGLAPCHPHENPRRQQIDSTDIDVVVINRTVDKERMSRATRQLDEAGLEYRRHEAVDKSQISDMTMRTELSAEGYALYLEHGDTPRFGSMTSGSLACALSWKSVLENQAASGSRYTLVLEDDFVLCEAFREKFPVVLKSLPPDFDMIYLSWNEGGLTNAIEIDEYFDRLYNPIHGTGAMLVAPESIPVMLDLYPLTRQLDHDIPYKLIVENRVRAYKGYYKRTRLITNDNLGGTTTQR